MHSRAAIAGCSRIKVGVAKGYVGLSLFEECLVVRNSSAIGSYPSHFGLTRCAPEQNAERRDYGNKSQDLGRIMIPHAMP